MRKLIFILFTLLSLGSFGQGCETQLCKTVKEILENLADEKVRREALNAEVKYLQDSISVLLSDGRYKNEVLTRLRNESTEYQNKLRALRNRIYNLESKLSVAIQELEEKENKSTEEELFLKRLLAERAEYERLLANRDESLRISELKLREMQLYTNRINEVEIGSGSTRDYVVIKKYEEGQGRFVPSFGLGSKKKLNIVSCSGNIILDKSERFSSTDGKFLIYADEDLIEVRDGVLNEVNQNNQQLLYYKFNSGPIELEQPFPKNSEIRVAFVETRTYLDKENYFDRFWDAQYAGLFTISNLDPNISRVERNAAELLDNCMLVQSGLVTSSNTVGIALKDYKFVDNDIVAIYANGIFIDKLELRRSYSREIKIYLNDNEVNTLTFIAISEGAENGCSLEILLISGDEELEKTFKRQLFVNRAQCFEIIQSSN